MKYMHKGHLLSHKQQVSFDHFIQEVNNEKRIFFDNVLDRKLLFRFGQQTKGAFCQSASKHLLNIWLDSVTLSVFQYRPTQIVVRRLLLELSAENMSSNMSP